MLQRRTAYVPHFKDAETHSMQMTPRARGPMQQRVLRAHGGSYLLVKRGLHRKRRRDAQQLQDGPQQLFLPSFNEPLIEEHLAQALQCKRRAVELREGAQRKLLVPGEFLLLRIRDVGTLCYGTWCLEGPSR